MTEIIMLKQIWKCWNKFIARSRSDRFLVCAWL